MAPARLALPGEQNRANEILRHQFYFNHSRLPDQLSLHFPNNINFHDTAASFEHQRH
jgi:hypothetical protein